MSGPPIENAATGFPACKHRKHQSRGPRLHGARWLASEPYRIFFFSGVIWSVIGVALWPLFYAQLITFSPNLVHARLMIQSFGGAFVVGFLGTAGPRMAGAPKLTPLELGWLLTLHLAGSLCHLAQWQFQGDVCFATLLASLMLSLVIRLVKFRRESPPPQMILALTGLICGIAGTLFHITGVSLRDPQWHRLANLLLDQGLLLPPVLGIGSFLFPRMLGGDFGETTDPLRNRKKRWRALLAAILLVAGFCLEAFGQVAAGYALRASVATVYLLIEVSWRPNQSGSLTTGLFWSLALGCLGLVLAPFHYGQHISIEHLLYIGGFGMLMLIVGSRVLFGHSGELESFFAKSGWVRFLIVLGVLAATTRATPAWVPSTTVSHHIYAAWTWALLGVLWLIWHRRRFAKRDAT